jgi:glycine betaine/proline transport system substrate-binding protein
MAKDYDRMIDKGYIIDLGDHSAVGKEDWWYPDYVEEFCPGLPDWRAMNSCAEIFSTATSNNKGVYYAGPWDYGDGDIIRALELNFTIHRFKNATEVWQKLTQAIEDKQPIMLLNWTPNWTDTRVKGKFVTFPKYQPECEIDPSWGLNQHLLKDCANPSNGWLKKVVWPGLEKYSPCVFKLIRNIDLTTKMISDASALVIIDGYNEEDAAKMWLKKHHKSVEQWSTFSCNTA